MVDSELAQLKTISVLYVEDDIEVRDQLSHFLKRRLGSLHLAGDGVEGLEVFRRVKPDVVITDVSMPRMDGLAMAKEIRAEDDSVPVVVTTAYNETDFLLRAIEIGIEGFAIKPVNPSTLVETVAKVAAARLRRREKEAQAKLLSFILNQSGDFVLLFSGQRPEAVSHSLLHFFNAASEDSLYLGCRVREDGSVEIKTCETAEGEVDCANLVLHPPSEDFRARLTGPDDPDGMLCDVHYRYFPELEKYVLCFVPVESEDSAAGSEPSADSAAADKS